MTATRRKWMLLVTVAITATVILGFVFREHEPSYLGKTLSEWIVVHCNELYASRQSLPAGHEGADAIRHIGTNGLPWLVEWVGYKPAPFSEWTYLLDNPKARRAHRTVIAFDVLHEQARPAIPELAKLLNTPRAKGLAAQNAAHALGFIGKDAFPVLTAHLQNSNAPNRSYVAEAFSLVESNDVPSVMPVLLRYMEDADPRVRSAVIESIQKIAPGALTNRPPL